MALYNLTLDLNVGDEQVANGLPLTFVRVEDGEGPDGSTTLAIEGRPVYTSSTPKVIQLWGGAAYYVFIGKERRGFTMPVADTVWGDIVWTDPVPGPPPDWTQIGEQWAETLAELELVRLADLPDVVDEAVAGLDLGGATPLGRELLRAPDQATALDALGVDSEAATRELVGGDLVTLTDDGTHLTIAAGYGEQSGMMPSIPRHAVKDASVSTISGNLRLSFFTANRSAAFAKVRAVSGSTAAGATPTLVRVGLYSVDAATGDLTLVASTTSDTAMLASTSTGYEKALDVTVTTVAGARYALGILVVTAATAPTLQGVVHLTATEAGRAPRLNGNLGSQTDLPPTISAGSVADSTSNPFLALVP